MGNFSGGSKDMNVNKLINTMIYSKSGDEVMKAARKFLSKRRVDLSKFIEDIDYA